MRKTLGGLIDELGLSGQMILDPDLQDRLAYHLLIRRGYHQFMSGAITRTEFGRQLAREWASFPVLANTKGAHRTVKRGQSYYAGDGVNKSLVRPDTLESVIDKARAMEQAIPKIDRVALPVPGIDKPMPKSTTFWSAIGGFATTAVTAISTLHPAVAGTIIVIAAGFAFWIIRERMKKAGAQRDLIEQVRGSA